MEKQNVENSFNTNDTIYTTVILYKSDKNFRERKLIDFLNKSTFEDYKIVK